MRGRLGMIQSLLGWMGDGDKSLSPCRSLACTKEDLPILDINGP